MSIDLQEEINHEDLTMDNVIAEKQGEQREKQGVNVKGKLRDHPPYMPALKMAMSIVSTVKGHIPSQT
jgi:hypothetical protein